jgi:hypothetical protein
VKEQSDRETTRNRDDRYRVAITIVTQAGAASKKVVRETRW